MSFKNDKSNTINLDHITRWGMYKQVRIEQIIDSCLNNIEPPSEEERKKIIEEWCREKKINSLETLKYWQFSNGLNEKQWNDYVTRKWRWSKWCYEKFENKISNYYLDRKSSLDRVKYSLLRLSNKDLANELYLRLKGNESTFEDIAREHSEGPEKDTFGQVGPMPLSRAHPDIATLLESSQLGQIWPPKRIESWWVIVKLNSIENVPLNDKLKIDLALELGLEYIEQEIAKDLNKSKYP